MSTIFGHGKTSMLKKLKISELSAAVEQIGKTGRYKTICHHLWWQARLFFIQFEVYKNSYFMEMGSSSKASQDYHKLPL